MAYLLFVDESGQDRRESPYEVLAGAAVHDTQLWPLVQAIENLEVGFFGQSFAGGQELKAKKLLKRKTFKLASQFPSMTPGVRRALAASALKDGAHAGARELTALAQAKVAFSERLLESCADHEVRLFASIVDRAAPRPAGAGLRKDYSYLFERFFNFLDEQAPPERGLVVFDELERSCVLPAHGEGPGEVSACRTGAVLRAQRSHHWDPNSGSCGIRNFLECPVSQQDEPTGTS